MSKYDDLFEETAPDDSVFADKGALDPLAEPAEIVARDAQERVLSLDIPLNCSPTPILGLGKAVERRAVLHQIRRFLRRVR